MKRRPPISTRTQPLCPYKTLFGSHRPRMAASAGPIGETEQQADVGTFLETPGALAPGETARRIDTHAAHIFLAGNRAWKLKRAVHYDYLDFSSPDKRH